MSDSLMLGVAGIAVLASFVTVSPTLCVLALLISVFGLCGFYQKGETK